MIELGLVRKAMEILTTPRPQLKKNPGGFPGFLELFVSRPIREARVSPPDRAGPARSGPPDQNRTKPSASGPF